MNKVVKYCHSGSIVKSHLLKFSESFNVLNYFQMYFFIFWWYWD
jgi:hypothetical protein